MFSLLVMVAILVSGCSFFNKDDKNEKKVNKKIVTTLDLPKATGKVSDAINALEVAVTSENSIVLEDEEGAKSVAIDDQETSDFNQVYNENEF